MSSGQVGERTPDSFRRKDHLAEGKAPESPSSDRGGLLEPSVKDSKIWGELEVGSV